MANPVPPPGDVTVENVGEFIGARLLSEVIRNGEAPQLAPPAPGGRYIAPLARSAAAKLKVQIFAGPKPDASWSPAGYVQFTYGWFCERWCSTYLFLESLNAPEDFDTPLIRILQPQYLFSWPEKIPAPWSVTESSVNHTNRIFPWVAYATVLHEIYHAIDGSTKSTPQLELACDRFAMDWLHGRRSDHLEDAVMVGLAIWVCCLCSEGLVKKGDEAYPSPIDRLLQFFDLVLSRETDGLSERVRAMCAGHLFKLTKEHERSNFESLVLERKQASWREFIIDCRRCWDCPS